MGSPKFRGYNSLESASLKNVVNPLRSCIVLGQMENSRPDIQKSPRIGDKKELLTPEQHKTGSSKSLLWDNIPPAGFFGFSAESTIEICPLSLPVRYSLTQSPG